MNNEIRNLKDCSESMIDDEFNMILNTFIDKEIIHKKLFIRIYEDAQDIFKNIILNVDAKIQRIDECSFIVMIDDVLPYLLYYIYDDIKSGEILSDAILLLFTTMNQGHLEKLYSKSEIIRLILKKFIKSLIDKTYEFSTVIKYRLWDRTMWRITLGVSDKINIDDFVDSVIIANEDEIKTEFNNIQYLACDIYDRLDSINYMKTNTTYTS